MKFKLFTLPCALSVMLLLLLTSCEKEGPAGPTGPAGPAGPAGPTGPQGPAGTANVFYSNWLDLTFEGSDTSAWTAEIAAPRLADSILAKGEVRVYVNLGTATEPAVLPLPLDASAFGFILTPLFEIGKITLFSNIDASTQTEANNEKVPQYRYIIIPGGTATGGVQGATGGTVKVDWGNYADVQNYLGLKD